MRLKIGGKRQSGHLSNVQHIMESSNAGAAVLALLFTQECSSFKESRHGCLEVAVPQISHAVCFSLKRAVSSALRVLVYS